ncbi:MAG TPA: family 10 glycosylhydrolase [Fimbriimonadaceae bacterium]|nr:family 10 glycosylhydrolase [Fimbriimonadaceae bacterium]
MLAAFLLLAAGHGHHQVHGPKVKPKNPRAAKATADQAPEFDPAAPISVRPPHSRFTTATPLPGAPGITIDRLLTGGGIANSVARARGLQARILWIDGTANIDRINTDDKISTLVEKVKNAGFNTIIWDGKPISGQTLYPSNLAPRMTSWRTAQMPLGFDPLRVMSREAKKHGLLLYVSLNAFSEGHQLLKVGPGYDKPAQQTVLYEPRVILRSVLGGSVFPCSSELNTLPADASQIGIFTDPSKLPKFPIDDTFAVSLAPRNRIVDGFEGKLAGDHVPTIPKGGAVLIGRGLAADFLRKNGLPGRTLPYGAVPSLVPISKRPAREIPLMMNPNNPEVQSYELEIARELVTNYPIDGIVYDDRLRYAGIDGDFSPETEAAFESFVGRKVDWPEGVYKWSISTNMTKGVVPGPEWDAWLAFRAQTIRNYLSRVRHVLRLANPNAQLGVYSGSDYGSYYSVGSNWASSDLVAGYWALTAGYRPTGYARLLDFLITGAYYRTATVHEALAESAPIGACIEAAGATTNAAVRDATWCVSGISLIDFKDDPVGLMHALAAACASTQGVMVFDLSHNIEPMWPVFATAFTSHVKPPQSDPAALAWVRRQRLEVDAKNPHEPPVIIMDGYAGTGM